MGGDRRSAGAHVIMPQVESRSRRARRQALMRAGIWVFLVLFVLSVVGVAIVSIQAR